jgi:AAA+ ATPase superfamily predicted ATPase
MIIGCEREIKKLNALYESGSAELIALYGRRGVGKTFLVNETFGDRICFRHAGLSPLAGSIGEKSGKNRMKDQLMHFHHSLKAFGGDSRKPESWLEAFYALEDFLSKKYGNDQRILVFIDEIQWLDTPRAGFMTGFEAFWNGWACHKKNIMVIVCGSSSSWMLDNLVNNHGGLYGRITYEVKIHPFSLGECEKYFRSEGILMSRYDITAAYMAVGGIPYYLRYFDRELSLSGNIDRMFFAETAPLKDEFDRMFSALFRDAEDMKLIVKALAGKSRGLTRAELIEVTGIPDSGDLSKKLRALLAGDFIISYSSFGDSKRHTRYKLFDPYCIFYLRVIDTSRKERNTDWISMESSHQVTAWRDLAFENVCWNHFGKIKEALGIGGVSTTESLWSERGCENEYGTQTDLVIERKDNVVHLCEMKFLGDEFEADRDYHLALERRKNLLSGSVSRKTVIHNTLITACGLKKTQHFSDFVHVLTLDDLF